MIKLLKKVFLFFGFRIQRIRNNPVMFYQDPWLIQASLFGRSKRDLVIFDVGSFNGMIAEKYKKTFPNSKIFCFEPFISSYERAKIRFRGVLGVDLYNFGLYDSNCFKEFYINRSKSTNSLLKASLVGYQVWGEKILGEEYKVEVELKTLDSVIESQGLECVDILKIDVQGSEIKVLKGGENSFKKGVVKVIFIEIITLPIYEENQEVFEIFRLTKEYGFSLFGTYSNSYAKNGQLRQFDAIFVHSSIDIEN